MKINFRLAVEEDLAMIEKIWIDGLQTINPSFIIDDSFLQLFRQNFHNRNEFFNFWVGENSKILGWCSILPAFSHPFKQKSHGEVSTYINKEFNSNGIGSEIMKYVYSQLENTRIECVFGFANNSNKRSIKMCENAGMVICGQMKLKTILIKEFL